MEAQLRVTTRWHCYRFQSQVHLPQVCLNVYPVWEDAKVLRWNLEGEFLLRLIGEFSHVLNVLSPRARDMCECYSSVSSSVKLLPWRPWTLGTGV